MSQYYFCYSCLKGFCEWCPLYLCHTYLKYYCDSCWSMIQPGKTCPNAEVGNCYSDSCDACNLWLKCEVCSKVFCGYACCPTCGVCSKALCSACDENHPTFNYCANNSCPNWNCAACADSSNVSNCDTCGMKYCFECRLEDYQNSLERATTTASDNGVCTGCEKIVVPELLSCNHGFRVGVDSLIYQLSRPSQT